MIEAVNLRVLARQGDGEAARAAADVEKTRRAGEVAVAREGDGGGQGVRLHRGGNTAPALEVDVAGAPAVDAAAGLALRLVG